MPNSKRRRMTETDFEAVMPFLKGKISDDRRAAAKAALVEGKTYISIAEIYGWTRQSVNDAVDQIWRAYESYNESQRTTANAGALLPPGWEQVVLIAPSHLIAKFRAEIAQVSQEGQETKSQEKPQEPNPRTKKKREP